MSLEYVIKAVDNFSGVFDDLEKKSKKVGESLTKVGKKMTIGITTPVVGLATAAVKTASDFDTSMSKVAAVSGAVGDDFDALREQAKELGSSTVFSASEASSGMEFLARAGFNTSEIMDAMPGMLDLAASSALDLGVAADITSNIMSGFGIAAEEAGRVSDVLAKAAASSNVDVEGLGEGMKFAAPVAAGLGISLEETAAAMGVLGDAGIQSSMAGTTLRSGLLRLASPTENVQKAMSDLGVEFFDAEGNMKSLTEIVTSLEGAMGEMTDQQKTQNLEMLFGKNAVSGWMAIVDAGGEKLGGFTDELLASEGAAATMAEVMTDNLGGAVTQLMSAVEGLMISFGEIMIPVLMEVVDWLTKVASWFTGLDENQKKIIITVAGVVAAIGPLLWILGQLVPGIKAVGTALSFLAANPVVLIVAAVAGLVAGLMYLYKTNDDVKDALNAAWEWLKGVAETVFNGILAFWEEWGELITGIFTTLWEGVKYVFESVFDVISELVSMVFGDILEFWEEWGDTIKETFEKYFELVRIVWTAVFDVLKALVETIFNGLKDFWDTWGGAIKTAFETILNAVKVVFEGVWNAIKIVVETTIGVIAGIVDFFLAAFKGDWEGAWNAVKDVFSSVWDGMTGIVRNNVNIIIGLANSVIGAFGKMVNGVGKAINAIPSFTVPDWVPGIGGNSFGLPKIPKVNLPTIPSLNIGTDKVFSDGLAMLHAGEAVVPAAEVARGGFSRDSRGNTPVIVNVSAADFTDPEHVRKMARIFGSEFGRQIGGVRA